MHMQRLFFYIIKKLRYVFCSARSFDNIFPKKFFFLTHTNRPLEPVAKLLQPHLLLLEDTSLRL